MCFKRSEAAGVNVGVLVLGAFVYMRVCVICWLCGQSH